MKRRSFLNIALGSAAAASLASMIFPAIDYLIPPPSAEPEVTEVKIGSSANIGLNTARVFKFGERAAIIIKTPNGELRAFDATCTHLGCTVQYRSEKADIWCPCHNGVYDLNGKNISGPPPRPLAPLRVTIFNDEITVSQA